MSEIPKDLSYAKTHEWIANDGDGTVTDAPAAGEWPAALAAEPQQLAPLSLPSRVCAAA